MIKKYFLLTLGCQMNKNDSERLESILCSMNFEATERQEEADLLLINTCSVRQSAEDRVFGFTHNWYKMNGRPDRVIGITGCLPGRDKDEKIKERFTGVDLYFPIEEMVELPRRLAGLRPDWFPVEVGEAGEYLAVMPKRKENFRAFVTIQTGCDNFCTYCVVPQARGREKNRPVGEILEEIRETVRAGAKEITLLGQVVNNYKAPDGGYDKNNPFLGDDFAALLWEINQIEPQAEFRINFTAADPQYFSDAQIEALKLPRQVNYLHLPAQSGDNEILQKMNRKYTREEYLELINKIKQVRPEIAIGTDLIVGFCGETELQFQNTLDLYHRSSFDISFHAMYSERSGTAAARAFKDDIKRLEKKLRWQKVQDLMENTTAQKNKKYEGQVLRVLVEKCEQGVCSGYCDEMKLVQFLGAPDLIGQLVRVKIFEPKTWVLKGEKIIL